MTTASEEPLKLGEIFDVLEEHSLDDGKLTIDEVIDAFGSRAYGPLLLTPALIGVLPIIGALPFVSLSVAFLLVLLSLQLAIGLEQPWLPGFLKGISLPGHRTVKALDACRPAARRVEKLFRPRMVFLTQQPWIRLTGVAALALSLLAVVGALAPGLIVPPLLVMIVLALGLAANDGLVVLISLALIFGAGWATWEFSEGLRNWVLGLF